VTAPAGEKHNSLNKARFATLIVNGLLKARQTQERVKPDSTWLSVWKKSGQSLVLRDFYFFGFVRTAVRDFYQFLFYAFSHSLVLERAYYCAPVIGTAELYQFASSYAFYITQLVLRLVFFEAAVIAKS
jgi:hypothetical protein